MPQNTGFQPTNKRYNGGRRGQTDADGGRRGHSDVVDGKRTADTGASLDHCFQRLTACLCNRVPTKSTTTRTTTVTRAGTITEMSSDRRAS